MKDTDLDFDEPLRVKRLAEKPFMLSAVKINGVIGLALYQIGEKRPAKGKHLMHSAAIREQFLDGLGIDGFGARGVPWRFKAGKLQVLSWSFSRPDNDPPHRHSTVATCTLTRIFGTTKRLAEINVITNHGSKTYWLTGSTDGFAGPRSRAINSTRTNNEAIAILWRVAVDRGDVEMIG